MTRIAQGGFHGTELLEATSENAGVPPPVIDAGKQPYSPEKTKARSSLKDNSRLLVIGGGIVLVLLLLAFSGLSKKPNTRKSATTNQNQPETGSQRETALASITPILDAGRAPVQERDASQISADQIANTASKPAKQSVPSNLGGVPPFDNQQSWQPPPYRSEARSAVPIDQNGKTLETINAQGEHDTMDKTSLVFVRNNPTSLTVKPEDTISPIAWGSTLAPGSRLRARLESFVSTAITIPVVAVIEYNYEQNGEIVVPAGAKAFGHLDAADRSGYVGIRFDSLLMPDGSSVNVEAAATDLQLRPLRGKVEGKHTGKNLVVRSLAGVGEIAATLVGRGSLDQPLSEGDLLRERVSNNIGQASDQRVANLAITEHLVVSIPAGSEIYVVMQKSAKGTTQSPHGQQPSQTASEVNIEQLRQLLQLQRELNDISATKSP